METPVPRPETINRLIFAADSAFAMLAGMQLDVFTPLKGSPMTAEDIAHAIGVGGPARLRLLLYALVAAGLLTEQEGCFSNTPEVNQFLVKGAPLYMGDRHTLLSHWWTVNLLKTAESIRSGVPQAKVDFSNSPQQELEVFLSSPLEAVGFNLAFINMLDVGESYTEKEYRDWLSEAGFVDIKRGNFLLADGSGLLTARKQV
jgi:hypothetical protein